MGIVCFGIESKSEGIFDRAGRRQKQPIRRQISNSKSSLFSVATLIVYQPIQGLIQIGCGSTKGVSAFKSSLKLI